MDTYGVIFDDDRANLSLARRILGRRYRVKGYAQVEDGLAQLAGAAFVVSDFDMPGMGGAGLLEMVRARQFGAPLLLLSGYDSVQPEAGDLEELGVGFLHKPYHAKELLAAVAAMLAGRNASVGTR